MTMLLEVATYLDTNIVALTAGTNLFAGDMPEAPQELVALYENPGITLIETQGGADPAVERPRLQVYVRSTDYATGRALMETVWKALWNVNNVTMTGTRYLHIMALTSPFFLDRDPERRPVFSCNFDVWKEPSA